MKRNLLFIILISAFSIQLSAICFHTSCLILHTSDSTIELKTVNINDEKLHRVTTGLKIESIDSLTLSHYISSDLADILSSQTTLYLKSYGLGSLAEISIRGTSAEQNAIFWNGFNINVPNIGLSDFALVPGSFFNKIEILYGGSSSVYGNGNIGGSIHLENEPFFTNTKTFNISSSVGSFNTFNENLRAVIANPHFCSITAVTLNSANNNFPYTNLTEPNAPIERLNNAQANSHGLLQQFSFLNSKSSTIDAAVWYQYDNKEIPPTLTDENKSEADEMDESLRSTLQWKKTTDNMSVIAKAAYFYNYEHYTDPLSSVNSEILNNTGIVELDFNKHFFCRSCAEENDSVAKLKTQNSELRIQNSQFDFNAGINYMLNQADIAAYYGSKQRYDAALFASVSHNFASVNWTADINLRQEFTQGYSVPLTPSLGMEGRIWKFISGRINISENFRTPTFNELFWQPGGNPDLKPETSFNQEAGIIIKPFSENVSHFRNVKHLTEFSITLFNSNINNLIQWIPVNAEIYKPQNIEEVHNRGAELKGKFSFSILNCQLSINLGYTYTKSTNQTKLSLLDNSVGKQLIYVPVNTALASVSLGYKTFDINYSQNYIDRRYTTSDNIDNIPGYSLGNCYISKQFKINVSHFQNVKHLGMQFNIDNIWNVSYVAIENMPMPGRFFRFTINLKLS